MRYFLRWSLVIGLAWPQSAISRAVPAVQVGQAVAVFEDSTLPSLVESWITVSPSNPDHLTVSALLDDFSASVVALSRDGGASWTTGRHPGGVRFPGGDPVVLAGLDGRTYFAAINPRLRIWASKDGGAQWSAPAAFNIGSVDREWLAQDHSNGPQRGRVYVAGKTGVRVFGSRAQDIGFLAYSSDGSAPFAAPRLFLPDPGQESLHTITDLQVGDDGTVLVPYLAFSWKNVDGPELLFGRYWLVTTRDGGRSFSEPQPVADVRLHGHSNESMSTKALGGGRLALDRTRGAFNGRRYFVFPNSASGVPQTMLVSGAAGGAWSSQVRVSDGPAGRSESNPAVAVGQDGLVAVTWNDRRGDPDDRCYQAYVAVSVDGGRSFLPTQPLGKRPVCPSEGRWLNGGDTQGLVALPGRRFMSAWIGADGPRSRVWTTLITVGR